MGWMIAFVIVAVVVALLVGGAVLHPAFFGFFIATVLVVPLWLASSLADGIVGSILGRRR